MLVPDLMLIDRVKKLCAPPGSGWAVSKAGVAPLATRFHEAAFGSSDASAVRAAWLASMEKSRLPDVGIIGVPYEGGTYGLGGAAGGPLGVRAALGGAQWRTVAERCLDMGDVPFFPGVPLDEMLAAEVVGHAKAARYGSSVSELPVCMLSIHRTIARLAASAGMRVLSLGGDHSISASAMTGLMTSRELAGVGLVHIDQHDDLSTGRDGLELLHSAWIHYVDRNTPLALVVQLGVPDVPAPEWIRPRLRRMTGRLLADPIAAADAAAEWLSEAGVSHAYLSIDIDAVESSAASATGLPAAEGLTVDHLVRFIERLSFNTVIAGADLVEIAPPLSGRRDWEGEATCLSGSRLALAMVCALARDRAHSAECCPETPG